MLDLNQQDCWPKDLRPLGEGFHQEEFCAWWGRNSQRLGHLAPRIAEQWVHRHFDHSPFTFIDLANVSWRLENWETARILREVHSRWADPTDAIWDYKIFMESSTPTGKPFAETGTWDFPIVVLETPAGFKEGVDERPEARYLLVEGHLRRRCLNALSPRGETAKTHELFLLSIDGTSNIRP